MFEGKQFLFKESKSTLGELWAEKIAAEVGKLLGLEMMHVQFAKSTDTYGVIMENFVPKGHELQDGGSLLSKTIPNFNVNLLDYYTVENIMNEISQFKMEKQFIELCLFDVLIASSDRHCENWGVIHHNGDYRFSPIFDNGDALGFNVPNRKLILYEKDLKAFQAFTNRAQTLIEVGGKRKPKITVLLNYLYNTYNQTMTEAIAHFKSLDYNEVLNILKQVPEEIMNMEQKNWVLRLISYRHDWLINYRWRSVEN